MEWVKAPNSMRKLILWMYGPAGAGKTAIAQSIAEECENEGLLAASFFFSRTAAGRNDTTRFIATLAYQLSRRIPEIEDHLFNAIEQDPTIFSCSLSTQIQVLVIEPLKAVPPLLRPVFLAVDGIDECGPGSRSQADILNTLATAISELQHIPFIILLVSRPEYEIREAFLSNRLSSLVKRLVLDENYKPDEDIRIFFNSVFQEIHNKHLRLGSHLPSPWPAQSDIDLLVLKASGQFIFAATVTKFIDSPRYSPVDRLKIILGLSSAGNETPFALLDALYRYILASVADIRKVLDVLTVLLLSEKYSSDMTVDMAEELLGFDVRRALIDMHALVFVPPPISDRPRKRGNRRSRDRDSVLRIHHASLYDFLMDSSRSLEYHIGINQGHASLCRSWLKVIASRPQSRQLQYTYLSLPISAFIYHHSHSEPSKEIADDLAHLNLRAGLEGISNLDVDLYRPNWTAFFECIKQQGGNRDDIFPRLRNEFDTFILDSIAQYPLPFRTFVPVLLQAFERDYCSTDILEILLHAVSRSAKELHRFLQLDERLLCLVQAVYDDEGKLFIMDLLEDKSRAGIYFVDGESYAALAKEIVSVICTKPGEKNHGISFEQIDEEDERYPEEGFDSEMRIRLLDPKLSWFPNILENASTDLDLAHYLFDRAIQYRYHGESWSSDPLPNRRTIAEASIKYI